MAKAPTQVATPTAPGSGLPRLEVSTSISRSWPAGHAVTNNGQPVLDYYKWQATASAEIKADATSEEIGAALVALQDVVDTHLMAQVDAIDAAYGGGSEGGEQS